MDKEARKGKEAGIEKGERFDSEDKTSHSKGENTQSTTQT